MNIRHKFLISSSILAGLLLLMGSSVFRLYKAELAARKAHKTTQYALKITHKLEQSLKDQSLALKDFIVLNHNTINMVHFQKVRSHFLVDLQELEFIMDGVPKEISFVRRRHRLLSNLANTINTNSNLAISQYNLQAINSYIKDITFYLDEISDQARRNNYAALNNIEQIRQLNTTLLVIGIIFIFLVFMFQLLVIIIPVINSLQKLKIGVAKIGGGDLDYYLDIQTNDEIEELASNFNQMTDKLSKVYQSLEARVTERTSELDKLNQDLQAEIIEKVETEIELQKSKIQIIQKAEELEQTLQELQETQMQLIQNEKMSSLGQLVAGIAHEINNPVNFIYGNITPLKEYIQNLLHLVNLYQGYHPQPPEEIEDYMEDVDLPFILEDTNKIMSSLEIGATRIREIVLSLRNFSRLDESEMKAVNIHEGIDNTLLILQHRIKSKTHHEEIKIIREYGDIPLIECYPGQLNQVFMNIISNAIDALEESKSKNDHNNSPASNTPPMIHIQTKQIKNNCVAIHISDNGMGISPDHHHRIFDPFFTTKPIGKGTGMGLSLSYQVVHSKHKGNLRCLTQLGKGAEFIIELLIKQDNSNT